MTTSSTPESIEVSKVSFMLGGESLNINEVSTALSIKPTHSQMKGELIERRRVPAFNNVWSYGISRNDEMQSVVRELVGMFYGKRNVIHELKSKYNLSSSIHLWLQPEADYGGGFSIESELMEKLSKISDRFDIVIM